MNLRSRKANATATPQLQFASVLLTLMLISAPGWGRTPIPSPPVVKASSYILMDHATGKVLAEKNANEQVEPASITKLMTTYVVFKELAQGQISLQDEVVISEKAWRTIGSRTFLEVGSKVSVEILLQGMIIQSGNDASIALAEHVSGDEQAFAQVMNHYAQMLKMDNSFFVNATGLPAEGHLTTARDVARLSSAIIREFPDYYAWFAVKEFTYNGIRQHNRNSLLWRDPAVDGLKTGHTEKAKYCLAASAVRSGMRLISVVMGSATEKSRSTESQTLLNYGFRFFESHTLYKAGEVLHTQEVWKGDRETIDLGVVAPVTIMIPRGSYDELDAKIHVDKTLVAPIEANAVMGEMVVKLDDLEVVVVPLYALHGVKEGGFWSGLIDSIELWFAEDDE